MSKFRLIVLYSIVLRSTENIYTNIEIQNYVSALVAWSFKGLTMQSQHSCFKFDQRLLIHVFLVSLYPHFLSPLRLTFLKK